MSRKTPDPFELDSVDSPSNDEDLSPDVLERLNDDLLRQALREHGQRLGLLEDKLDRYIEELRAIRTIVRKSSRRTERLARALGVKVDDSGDQA